MLEGLPQPKRRARPAVDGVPLGGAPAGRPGVRRPASRAPRPGRSSTWCPAALADTAVPGTRVKVRFGAQDVNGYVAGARRRRPTTTARSLPVRKVVSDRAGAHAAGRPAGPGRRGPVGGHAERRAAARRSPRGTRASRPRRPRPRTTRPAPSPSRHRVGAVPRRCAFLQHVTAGGAPRAVWSALPGADGRAVARRDRAGGRGVRAGRPRCARRRARRPGHRPRARARWPTPASRAGRPGRRGGAVRLAADDGPAVRYRSFLAALRGPGVGRRRHPCVGVRPGGGPRARRRVGRRGPAARRAASAVPARPRGAGPAVRARAVRAARRRARAQRRGAGAGRVAAGRARSPRTGPTTRARAPRVQALTSVELAREGPGRGRAAPGPGVAHAAGPAGRRPGARAGAAGRLRARGRVRAVPGGGALRRLPRPARADHGRRRPDVRLVRAAGHGLAVHRVRCGGAAVGPRRLGADRRGARPRVPGGPDPRLRRPRGRRRARRPSPDVPAVVVATPGAEPVAPGGYAAALLLDAAVSTAGASLRTGEDALRRWLDGRRAGASGVRGRDGRARRRRRGAGHAGARALGPRPGTRRASSPSGRSSPCRPPCGWPRSPARGTPSTRCCPGSTSPTPRSSARSRSTRAEQDALEPDVRALVRVPRTGGAALARALSASLAVRSARREGGTVRVQMDPAELG